MAYVVVHVSGGLNAKKEAKLPVIAIAKMSCEGRAQEMAPAILCAHMSVRTCARTCACACACVCVRACACERTRVRFG